MSKIIYFTKNEIVTAEDLAEIARVKATRVLNAESIAADDPVEACDWVAGEVPDAYLDFPMLGAINSSKDDE